ncbi:hypothetical protein ACWCXB_24005 [Streptomyces sp. NPDC001514]
MATESRTPRGSRAPRTARGIAALVLLFLVCLALGLRPSAAEAAPAPTPPPVSSDPAGTHASYGPDSGRLPPDEWSGVQAGVDSAGNYCQLYRAQDCVPLRSADLSQADGSDRELQALETRRLEEWRDKANRSAKDFDKLDAFLTTCVKGGDTFQECLARGARTYPAAAGGSQAWVAGKISDAASDALQETAGYIANAVIWLLEEFADVFGVASSIDLDGRGVGDLAAIGTALSAVVAVFLLLLQFGKVALSQRGGPAATAFGGLAKWAVISSVYLLAVQTALTWTDAVSNWIVNYTFGEGGTDGQDAADAMRTQLGRMFSGLIAGRAGTGGKDALVVGDRVDAPATGVIIVLGIVCILAIGALWVELLLRQAGILILVALMPLILVGQMSDGTRSWWPRARDMLITLILLKPVVMICFSIGFFALSPGNGAQNLIVGLVVFLMACASWPVLAKFVTPARITAGLKLDGLLGSRGSTTAAHPAHLTGAGAVGGGAAYTRALETETTSGTAQMPRAQSTQRPFWSGQLLEARPRAKDRTAGGRPRKRHTAPAAPPQDGRTPVPVPMQPVPPSHASTDGDTGPNKEV